MRESNISANTRIAKNSVFMSIRLILVLGITLYTTRAVLKVLGVEDYGIYNVICGFVSMFAFLNTSMSNGIQRFYNFELGKNGQIGANRVYNVSIISQLILTAVIVLFTETIGLWYLKNVMVIPLERSQVAGCIFQFSVASLIVVIMQAPYTAAVMAHEKMGFYSAASVLDAVLKLVLVFIIPFVPADRLILYGLSLLMIQVLVFLLYFIYCRRNFDEVRFKRSGSCDLLKTMLSFSGWNVLGSFANMMKDQGINMVINIFFGPVVNAARGVAAQVNSGLQSFVQNITVPVRPQIVQSYASGNISRTLSLTYSVSKLSCMLLYFISLPVVLEIDTILNIWLGNNVPEHASTFVIIIVLTSFVNNLNAAVSNVVHATGKMMLYQITGSVCILMAIPLAYVVLRLGGTAELAIAMTLLSMIVAQIVALFVLRTLIEFSIRDYCSFTIFPMIKIVCISIWPSLLLHIFMDGGLLRLFCVGIVSILVCSSVIYRFGLSSSERNLLLGLIRKFKK